MKTTTLNRIRDHAPSLYEHLLEGLGKTKSDDELLSYATIQKLCGLYTALALSKIEPQYDWRKLASIYARRAAHISDDPEVKSALDVVGSAENDYMTLMTSMSVVNAMFKAKDQSNELQELAANAVWSAIRPTLDLDGAADSSLRAISLAAIKDGMSDDDAMYEREAVRDAELAEQRRLFLEFVNQ
jgi:hypothetical protein